MLERMLKTLLPVYLATSLAWTAESPFLGKWKLDASKTRMPDEMKVESKGTNEYAFDFGGGTETIRVDGSDQPGVGGTLLSVQAQAPDTWVVRRKQGSRLLLNATWQLSDDGRTLTDHYREFEADGSTMSMDYVYQRAGAGSGFAGDWQSIKETMNSPFLLEVKQFQGDGLSFVLPTERKTKNVRFDGKDYPNEGPNAARDASSSGRQVDARTVVITDKVGGRVTDTEDIVLSTDLKTLTMTVHITGRARPNVLVFERGSQGFNARPPRSPDELAERYRQAHLHKDTDAIGRLFYWGASTDKTRMLVTSFISQDVAHAIRRVSVKPLDPKDLTEYTQDGIRYRMTLPATAKIVIDFLPRSDRGGTYNSEQTSYFIGVRNGEYWLVTTEPSR